MLVTELVEISKSVLEICSVWETLAVSSLTTVEAICATEGWELKGEIESEVEDAMEFSLLLMLWLSGEMLFKESVMMTLEM